MKVMNKDDFEDLIDAIVPTNFKENLDEDALAPYLKQFIEVGEQRG